MKRLVFMLAIIAAITAGSVSAKNVTNNRDEVISRTDEPGIFHDESGDYHWQRIEKRIWIPEYQTAGIFGIGRRTIPAHYEMRTDRIKVYHRADQYNSRRSDNSSYPYNRGNGNKKGWAKHNKQSAYYNSNESDHGNCDGGKKHHSKKDKHDRDDD